MAAPFREFRDKRTGRTYTVRMLRPSFLLWQVGAVEQLAQVEQAESMEHLSPSLAYVNWYDLPTPTGQKPLVARGVYVMPYMVRVDNDPEWYAMVEFQNGDLVKEYRQVDFKQITISKGVNPITNTALPLDAIRRAALQVGAVFGRVFPPGHSVPGESEVLPNGCIIQKLTVGEDDVEQIDIVGLTGHGKKLRIYDPQSLREVLHHVNEHKRLKTTGEETRSQLVYVSDATGRPENTVAKMIKRARKDLRGHEPQTVTTTKKRKTRNMRTKRPAKAVRAAVARKHEPIESGRKRK